MKIQSRNSLGNFEIGGTVQDPQVDFFMGAMLIVIFALLGIITVTGMFLVGMKTYLFVILAIEVMGFIAGMVRFCRSIAWDEPDSEPERST